MQISEVMMLLGGLGLFLYGMKLMGDGLEMAAGSRLKKIVEKLTRNKYMGALVGLLVTMIIQSSSSTTVMVVGFVNAGLMTLAQATGVMAGLTNISNVHGYLIRDEEKVPDEGKLIYRGIDLGELVDGCIRDDRFGFEEVEWLLLFGRLPNKTP